MTLATTTAIDYTATIRDPVTFTLRAELKSRTDDPQGQDVWQCQITSSYPGAMSLEFKTGTGLRGGFKLPYMRRTIHDIEQWKARSFPKPPTIRDVLICIGLDYHTARDMPRDEADACDAMVAEGIGDGTKPGDVLRMVRALNKQADAVRSLLRHTGIDPDHFADWCASLDA